MNGSVISRSSRAVVPQSPSGHAPEADGTAVDASAFAALLAGLVVPTGTPADGSVVTPEAPTTRAPAALTTEPPLTNGELTDLAAPTVAESGAKPEARAAGIDLAPSAVPVEPPASTPADGATVAAPTPPADIVRPDMAMPRTPKPGLPDTTARSSAPVSDVDAATPPAPVAPAAITPTAVDAPTATAPASEAPPADATPTGARRADVPPIELPRVEAPTPPPGEHDRPIEGLPGAEAAERADEAEAPADHTLSSLAHRAPAPRAEGPAAATPAAPAAPIPDATPTEAVARVITELAEVGEGHHRATIELHPAELGHVTVEVHVDHGVVHVQVHAEQPATRELLHDQLGDLRAQLEHAGLSTGDLHANSGRRRAEGHESRPQEARRGPDPVATPAPVAPLTPRPHVLDGDAVDVLL